MTWVVFHLLHLKTCDMYVLSRSQHNEMIYKSLAAYTTPFLANFSD